MTLWRPACNPARADFATADSARDFGGVFHARFLSQTHRAAPDKQVEAGFAAVSNGAFFRRRKRPTALLTGWVRPVHPAEPDQLLGVFCGCAW